MNWVITRNKEYNSKGRLQSLDEAVQLDADIWLPPQTKGILERSKILDKKCIFGIDRFMCNSYKDWINYLYVNMKPIHEGWIYLHTDIFPIGTRVVQYKGEGYYPIGFFQLWNPNGSSIKEYPVDKVGYDRTDVVHLKQWSPADRRFVPDIICIHLASEDHKQGQNWKGRNTVKFGPDEEVEKETFIEKIKKFFIKIKKYICNIFKKKKKYC